MQIVEVNEDKVWQNLMDVLASGGRFARFRKLAPSELRAVMKHAGAQSTRDMYQLYAVMMQNRYDDCLNKVNAMPEPRAFAVLYTLIRSMKCWVESESPVSNVRGRWKVAHG